MKQQIITMLEMQESMNAKVNPSWREADYPWYRAIFVECAEMMDHHGWKWWKKQEPNMDQVKLELVDIWHFGLSRKLSEDDKILPFEEITSTILDEYNIIHGNHDRRFPITTIPLEIERFATVTLRSEGFIPNAFFLLMDTVGMTFDELYTGYVGKNVLNFFRQDHGYKEGTYIKMWDGKEDNEYLVELTAKLDSTRPNFKDKLYSCLEECYNNVINHLPDA